MWSTFVEVPEKIRKNKNVGTYASCSYVCPCAVVRERGKGENPPSKRELLEEDFISDSVLYFIVRKTAGPDGKSGVKCSWQLVACHVYKSGACHLEIACDYTAAASVFISPVIF